MELSEARKELEKVLTPIFQANSFARRSSLVWMRAGQSDQFILLGVRKDARGHFAATVSLGIRFGITSQLLEGSPTNGIHINAPLHLLESDGRFSEWNFSNALQLRALAESAVRDFDTLILPFFDRFGRPDKMRDRLQSETPRDWFTLSWEQRVELLAAIEAGLGNHAKAIELVNAELEKLRDALPKKRYALEELRAKLSGFNSKSQPAC